MKKYALILLALILFGVGLTIVFFSQDEKLDQTVFLQTTESIRNLQSLDKNLLLQLNKSRFNPQFDNDELAELNYQLSEEFDNFRYEALFEEIEKTPDLIAAISAFEDQFNARDDILNEYIDGNSEISKSLLSINSLASMLEVNGELQNNDKLLKSLNVNNSRITGLALGRMLDVELDEIEPDIDFSVDTVEKIDLYNEAVQSIRKQLPPTNSYFSELSKLGTGALLDDIEIHYGAYQNKAIEGSNRLRNGLIAYGFLLLAALLFFGIQIRKNFVNLEQEVADRTSEIKTAYDELQESQEQLIQSEKMASLGQMVAGVAHEINTPLGYVSSNIETLNYNLGDLNLLMSDLKTLMSSVGKPQRDNREITERLLATVKRYRQVEAPDLMDESQQLLNDGAYGLSEISTLVGSLKDFARLDRKNSEQINVHECIDSSVTIASNHVRENNVTVIKEYSDLPTISCFPSKLNQLFLNIITNACQAMSNTGGDLVISTQLIGDEIKIDFNDQGIGMNEETQQKMFDPFFTSKEIGVGTGLGLSIAYKIIEAHNGRVEVNSALGNGTTMTVILPTNMNTERNNEN